MTLTKPAGDDPGAIHRVFGTELPQESADERDPHASRDAEDREQWLRDNVPPHHI
ncbi:MAG TPA: hypothetical protein VGG53_15720 [Mycobacterium sp.]|jgi:hypothetical protein|uniref:hypothetical protein n=1 Tax=Mycobacterium sp. TaxID=1785 RepID=UPI002F42B59E